MTSGELGKAMSFETPLFDINYGIGDNLQLKVEAPFQLTRSDGVTRSSVDAAEIGIKHRFFEDESRDMTIAVYPQVEFGIPGTAAADEDSPMIELPVLLSTKVGEIAKGDVMITANLGYNLTTGAETPDFLFAAFGIGFPLTSNIAMMLEDSTEQPLGNNMAGVREAVYKANAGFLGKNSAAEDGDTTHTCLMAGLRPIAGGP